MSKYLFIGGPADGKHVVVQHVELHNPHSIMVLKPPSFELRMERTLLMEESSVERIEYWPHRLWFGDEQETVYTPNRHEDPIKIIRALIAGYRNKG